NARALHVAQGLAATATADRLLAVVDPRPSSRRGLRYAAVEAACAAHAFAGDSQQLRHERANKETVRRLMPQYPVVHFACHGSVDLTEPLDSALHLAGDVPLAAREIMALRLS